MSVVSVVFWLLLGILFYTYLGYAALLVIFRAFKRHPVQKKDIELPELTLIIASYNEASILEAKIENTLSLEYPAGKLQIVVVTDGSTDTSLSILKRYPSVKVFHQAERRGKAAAINRVMQVVQTPVAVFSDANTLLNTLSLRLLVSHFIDRRIGAVAGEKKVAANSGMGSAEGWYWAYESFMKKLDASFYTVLGAAGELFALRTSLFKPLNEDTILDDFMLSMRICLQGFQIAYEPGAFALEAPSASLANEQERKVRIAAGAFQALKQLPLRQIASKPALAFQFLSRRWLRWVVCPTALILLGLLNTVLAIWTDSQFWLFLLCLQILFYFLAVIGWNYIRKNKVSILTTVPFYFVFMNFCMLLGLFQFWQRKGTVLWTKAERL